MRRQTNARPPGFYVYAWRDGEDVFYIGKGNAERAWCMTGRSAQLLALRDAARRFNVTLLHTGLNKTDARRKESQEIQERAPTGNICLDEHRMPTPAESAEAFRRAYAHEPDFIKASGTLLIPPSHPLFPLTLM